MEIEACQSRIEEKLGVSRSETVIFESRLDLPQITIEKVLDYSSRLEQGSRATRRLSPLVHQRCDTGGGAAHPELLKTPALPRDICAALGGMEHPVRSHLKWEDCPIGLDFSS